MVFNHALKIPSEQGVSLREGQSAEVSPFPRPGALWRGVGGRGEGRQIA